MPFLRSAFAVILFFLFFPPIFANERLEEVAGKGLEIQSNPSGAAVYIDGMEYGNTPVYIGNLKPGRYRIELFKEGFEQYELNIILREDSRLVITVEMESAQGLANISLQRASGSPEDLPFSPLLFSVRQDKTLSAIHLTSDNKAQINLPLNMNNGIIARAFGWEDTQLNIHLKDQQPLEVNIIMKSAAFKMENISQSRRRFNPMNPNKLGSAQYSFEVSSYGKGFIVIFDSNGNEVIRKQLDTFDTWVQNISWDGKDSQGNILPQGLYTIVIEAQDTLGEIHSLNIKTEINYSINIFPLSLESGVAGLTFVPMPDTLPGGSYQFNAGIIFGSFGIPFKINMRISPVNNLELTTVFSLNAGTAQTGWGFSGSVKYNFFGGDSLLALSAGVSYAWASGSGEYVLSPGKGVGIHAPLSFKLNDFSVVFCPSVFWHGPEGFTPELLLGLGALYTGKWITGGISARGEIDFADNKFRFLAGAEINFIPAPSYFIITVHGGIITAAVTDWYAGLGIGFVY